MFVSKDDEEVVKDLIDDNPIEEEESDNESDGSRKRKKSDDEDDFDDRLEEEDYDLLEENLGVKVQRVTIIIHSISKCSNCYSFKKNIQWPISNFSFQLCRRDSNE